MNGGHELCRPCLAGWNEIHRRHSEEVKRFLDQDPGGGALVPARRTPPPQPPRRARQADPFDTRF